MLQDLYPHIYHNEMAWKAPAPDDYALIFAPDGTGAFQAISLW